MDAGLPPRLKLALGVGVGEVVPLPLPLPLPTGETTTTGVVEGERVGEGLGVSTAEEVVLGVS